MPKHPKVDGLTIMKYNEIVPSPRQLQHQVVLGTTRTLIHARVNAHVKEHGMSDVWVAGVSYYYEHLLTGRRMPGRIRLDDETKKLVVEWVNEARAKTGLKPPNRATKRGQRSRRR